MSHFPSQVSHSTFVVEYRTAHADWSKTFDQEAEAKAFYEATLKDDNFIEACLFIRATVIAPLDWAQK